jgi:hypothetical protein
VPRASCKPRGLLSLFPIFQLPFDRSALSLDLLRAPLSQAMGDSFGERITPAGAIKQILGSYPFSVGLFRELLQNSDDARASTQVRSRLHILLRSSIL